MDRHARSNGWVIYVLDLWHGGHLLWTQRLAAPSQHNSSNSYVGDGEADEEQRKKEEAAAETGQLEMIKQTMNQGGHHRSSSRFCLLPSETSQHHLRVPRGNPARLSRDVLILNGLFFIIIILPLSFPGTAGHLGPSAGWDASPFSADTWQTHKEMASWPPACVTATLTAAFRVQTVGLELFWH